MAVTHSDYTVYAGETIQLRDEYLHLQQKAEGTIALTVEGRLEVTYDTMATNDYYFPTLLRGVLVEDHGYASRMTVGVNGVIKVTSNVPGSTVAFFHSGDSNLSNAGRIETTGVASALGLATWNADPFVNSGTFKVTAALQAVGVVMVNGGAFTNTGAIEVIGGTFKPYPYPYGGVVREGPELTAGVSMRGFQATFLNTGTIRVTDADPTVDTVGANWSVELHPYYTSNAWVNKGTIEADIALRSTAGSTGGDPMAPMDNQGLLVGRVELGVKADSLRNAGEIRGAVNLGAGEDTYAGETGVLTGPLNAGAGADTVIGGAGAETLSGGSGDDQLYGQGGNDVLDGGPGRNLLRGEEGSDSLTGGAEFDDLHGNMGDDLVLGGDGGDWVVGGKDQDRLYGEAGGDVVLGNMGNDTIDGGAGADVVRGGQGDDVVLGGEGDDWLAGDRGSDTVTGGAGADVFHSFAEAGLDVITDFNAVEGDRLNLFAGSTFDVRQSGADTIVDITGGTQVVLQKVQLAALPSGWIFGA